GHARGRVGGGPAGGVLPHGTGAGGGPLLPRRWIHGRSDDPQRAPVVRRARPGGGLRAHGLAGRSLGHAVVPGVVHMMPGSVPAHRGVLPPNGPYPCVDISSCSAQAFSFSTPTPSAIMTP